ncbi:MAG TPA: efflux RND transporter periplasmic adaptor subunit [Armatimonadota bacterium]|jgi:RND family efflux transporter MFP subunit
MAATAPVESKSRKPFLRRYSRLLVVIVVVLALVAGGLIWRAKSAKPELAGVRTAQITRGTLTKTIVSTGLIAAQTGADVKIGSQITGRIKRLYADLDTQVTAGQVIAELDAPDLQANLDSARRNQAQAEARYTQQLEGVSMTHTQVATAFEQASENIHRSQSVSQQSSAGLVSAQSRLASSQAGLTSAQARQRSAEANLRSARASAAQQPIQTSTDIRRAEAALSTARSSLRQTQVGVEQQISSSQAALKQAQANATLAAATLGRQETLLAKGYVAQQDVDTARAAKEVADQTVATAQANLQLTRDKTTADLQSAQDQVTQAEAALQAAQAETNTNAVRTEAVAAAEASVADAVAAVQAARMAIESAQSDIVSARAALQASGSDVRNSQTAQQTALANLTQDKLKQQDVKAAYEAVMQTRAQVAFQSAQFDKSFIRTPISGTVVTLTQQQGETVAAGLSAPTLIEVVDLKRLQVNAYVDETDIGQVRVGQAAAVTVDAYPKRNFPGKVTAVAAAATMQQNVVTYLVTVALDTPPVGALKPQMTANVTITVQQKDNIVLAPNEAIKAQKSGTKVVVMNAGTPEVRPVTTGLTDGTNTEVVSGLQEGETVVLAGFDKLGITGFASGAGVPGFLTRGPLGTGSSSTNGAGARGGGAARGGGGGGRGG